MNTTKKYSKILSIRYQQLHTLFLLMNIWLNIHTTLTNYQKK